MLSFPTLIVAPLEHGLKTFPSPSRSLLWPFFLPLFTGVRGSRILRSSRYQGPGRSLYLGPLAPPTGTSWAGGECGRNTRGEDALRAVATCYSQLFLM